MTGFAPQEFEARVARARGLMAQAGIEALLLTTEPEVRYFTGFLTRFWESPTRPWFVIVPAQGQPIAVIPSIGAPLMAQSWLRDIRTWRSPDYSDDGVSLVADTIAEVVPKGGRIGVPSGPETHMRLPLESWAAIRAKLPDHSFGDDAQITKQIRMVKSTAEIAKIEAACAIGNAAFARVPEIAQAGVPLAQIFRAFQMLCLEEGADWVSYLAGGAGPGGYGDIIAPATDAPLRAGDVLMLDTGVVRDGYFCDFDRNWSIGPPASETQDAYARLLDASDAAFEMARPGATAADLFHAMDSVLTGGAGGSDAGRYGHGLGMQLTEWPSLIPQDQTVLEAGMVLTLEPGIEITLGRTLVHEENIVITETGARYLSTPALRDIPVI
ncbi:Xaa-Pro peptidase family protein [uncultured Tateyamaria sp.]|uniref:M24 family metallopeptidase n=1 Tax=uncultured Tateyamaria sp. TaxID=455651 RepID=UPI002607EA4A|nr:Xaa-Pro peptidase family protein [uncultured Tateyamaria sp.]